MKRIGRISQSDSQIPVERPKVLPARRTNLAPPRLLDASEQAQTVGAPAIATKPAAYTRAPALFLLLAASALAWQGIAPTAAPAGAPLLIAGAALGVAALLLVVPRVTPRLRRWVFVEVLAALPLAGAGYALARLAAPAELVSLLFVVGVFFLSLAVSSSRRAPWCAATVMGVAYVAGAGSSPPVLVCVAAAAAAALAMTVSAARAQRLRDGLSTQIEGLVAENSQLAADNAATKEASEVATAVLDVANEFTAALDPAAIADQIAKGTSSQLQTVGTILLLWDEAVETFRIGAIHGRHVPNGTELRHVEVQPDSIPTLRGNPSGEVLQVDPAALREPVVMSALRRWKANTLLGVRLQRGDRLVGLLFAARSEHQPRFGSRDCRVLAGIAIHAAAALDYASLIADLQSANQLKEEFMATMSHELRTPLNVIIGYTDLQIEGAFGDLSPDHLETLQTIRSQALQLLELIQATLDMSRLERGLMTVDLRDISIPQFIEQLQVQIPPAWRKPTVELNWRVEPGLPPMRTDPNKLQIILRNLIHNGLKFTHHGMVTVSVAAQLAKQQITFVVQDSGIGIKSEHLSEIFEMFRQAPNGETSPGGVGLGLYIVKRLASVLGAEIEVSSAPGRGATFRIHLPIAGPLAARAA